MKHNNKINELTLFAQPYDINEMGFYFESFDDYKEKADKLRNSSGQPVEEFEIQLIEGASIDCDLFNALQVHQGDIEAFFEAFDNWTDDEKIKVIIAVGECGYDFNLENDNPDREDQPRTDGLPNKKNPRIAVVKRQRRAAGQKDQRAHQKQRSDRNQLAFLLRIVTPNLVQDDETQAPQSKR